jgi:hypothetical protein
MQLLRAVYDSRPAHRRSVGVDVNAHCWPTGSLPDELCSGPGAQMASRRRSTCTKLGIGSLATLAAGPHFRGDRLPSWGPLSKDRASDPEASPMRRAASLAHDRHGSYRSVRFESAVRRPPGRRSAFRGRVGNPLRGGAPVTRLADFVIARRRWIVVAWVISARWMFSGAAHSHRS